jgi:hypothetical protein
MEVSRKSGKATRRMLEGRFPDLLERRMDEITPWLIEK